MDAIDQALAMNQISRSAQLARSAQNASTNNGITQSEIFFVKIGKDGTDGEYRISAETKELAEKWILWYNPEFKYDKEQDLYVTHYPYCVAATWAKICIFPFLKNKP